MKKTSLKELKFPVWLVLVLLVMAFVGGVILGKVSDQILYPSTVTLTDFFADVDGNGQPDYVKKAIFVLNYGGIPEKSEVEEALVNPPQP